MFFFFNKKLDLKNKHDYRNNPNLFKIWVVINLDNFIGNDSFLNQHYSISSVFFRSVAKIYPSLK
ncbi:hypothetical protein C7447_104112 [Tenacibaculum adriaticum]|uniref:Uncharacterized protein n=1 Tax=Tenacibaculum adriaticum TaxID=413713 RepID=A0A5S5DQZ1_9FLAO|nr:hypothetical protein C7447_104112 [Tenacibaculum adriaticum]